jgi:hypothetical protein
MSFISVTDAAARIGVSPRRVRAMLLSGDLSGERIGRQWTVDASSLRPAPRRAGQPFSPRIAWAFIELADGRVPEWVSPSELSRLRRRWKSYRARDDAVPALRSVLARRAESSRWSAPDPAGLLKDPRFMVSGKSDRRAGISAASYAEGYAHAGDADDLVRQHMLLPARGPENVMLRVVDGPVPDPVPWLAVVVDLADGDVRDNQQAEVLFAKEIRHD